MKSRRKTVLPEMTSPSKKGSGKRFWHYAKASVGRLKEEGVVTLIYCSDQ